MNEDKLQPCIIIDSNAWNFLHASGIELDSPLLSGYEFAITLEILREMEVLESKPGKTDIYLHFKAQMDFLGEEKVYFGFFDSECTDDEQRSGGFGYGSFASEQERVFIEKHSHMIKKSKRGIYYGNEADLLIASRAGGNTYILSGDNTKSGPLKGVANIIQVSQFSPMSIGEFKKLLDSST